MIDRDKVARAVMLAQGCGLMRGAGRVFCTHCDCGEVADAAIAAVLEQLREPVSALVAFHKSGGHEGDGSDASLARIAAFLQPPDSSNPAE